MHFCLESLLLSAYVHVHANFEEERGRLLFVKGSWTTGRQELFLKQWFSVGLYAS